MIENTKPKMANLEGFAVTNLLLPRQPRVGTAPIGIQTVWTAQLQMSQGSLLDLFLKLIAKETNVASLCPNTSYPLLLVRPGN